jgi:AcrR family transcriptional regulator
MTEVRRGAGADAPTKGGRPRDAAASRQALLDAAQDLFGQNGFEGTTIREIGDRAGVDAALIARYFGSKADLYIAAVAAERVGEEQPAEFEQLGQIIDVLVTRVDEHGPGPIMQALIRSDTSDDIRRAARARLARRLVAPLADGMSSHGVDRPGLRAELAVSALIGIGLGRSLGWFDEMQSVPRDELIDLVDGTLSVMTGEAVSHRSGQP